METRYKIIEHKGIFIVYRNRFKKVWRLFKPSLLKEVWVLAHKDAFTPAHFETLYDAKAWVKVQLTPDKEHGVYSASENINLK